MEEIDYKLQQNNAILIAQGVSKLIDVIKVKKSQGDRNTSDLDVPELQLLKSKCGVQDANVSITASHGIVSLVEEGVLSIGSTMSDLMVILSTAKCPTGIAMAIGNLLLLGIRRDVEINKTYKCPFNIQKPQHPLISILSQNYDIWREIFNQIQLFVNHYDPKIASNSVELLRPVFFYVMCDPKPKLQETARRQLWNLLASKDDSDIINLTFEILAWMQNNTRQTSLQLNDFLLESCVFAMKCDANAQVCPSLILYLTSTMHKLVGYGCDPTPNIRIIIEMLETKTTVSITHSVLLMILAETIIICPPIYLTDVLRLCKIIILKKSANLYSVKTVVSSVLQWLLSPSRLLCDAIKIANEIITFTESNETYAALTANLYRDKYFGYILFADAHIDFILKLNILAEKWQANDSYLLNWLLHVRDLTPKLTHSLFNFLSAIFIHGHKNALVHVRTLDILLKLLEYSKDISYNILVLILYKVANERDPDGQVALLKALPLMAVAKQNIPLIIGTLDTVKNGPMHLRTLSFELYLNLWKTEVRCFPYLQKLLLETRDDHNWEYGVAKAHTLKEICTRRPELHGKEMVVHLSNILNKYSNEKGSTASALALQGIAVLCEEGIVDIVSTWKSISPKFVKDKRPAVVKSLCEFLSKYSKLRAETEDQEENINEVVEKLWHYVSYSEDVDVIAAASKSLSCFDLEQIKLKSIPDLYRQNLKLPPSYVKTPIDAAKKPEDVLPYVPGDCWVQFLQNINHDAMNAAGDLLIEWVRAEIAAYKSSVYTVVEGKPEPCHFDYLPDKSIIRGLGNYLRLSNNPSSKVSFSENIVKQCLRILGENYSKPLPPQDWTFLKYFLLKGFEIPCFTINVLCKQILISESARLIVDKYVTDFQPDIKTTYEMKMLFGNLTILCKGMSPNTLRPMITKSLDNSYQRGIKNDPADYNTEDLFKTLVYSIRDTLLDPDIHDANRTLIGQIIEIFTDQTDAHNKLYDILVECIVEIPSKYQERISSPSLWWATTDAKFEKAFKVRCFLSKRSSTKPFVWLNECINTAATLPSVQIYTLKLILDVFQHHSQHFSVSDWILELMGQIQEKLTNETKDMNEIIFLCDVFLIAIISFSGCECLYSPIELVAIAKEVRFSLFPNAVFNFIGTHQHITLQFLEWFYHMTESNLNIPFEYNMLFYQSLIILKHEDAFCSSSKWMKYMSVKRPN